MIVKKTQPLINSKAYLFSAEAILKILKYHIKIGRMAPAPSPYRKELWSRPVIKNWNYKKKYNTKKQKFNGEMNKKIYFTRFLVKFL